MSRASRFASCLVISLLVTSGAAAEDVAPSEPGAATGLALQARMPTQLSLVGAITASPGFIVGYRADAITIGLGAGLAFTSIGADADTEVDITVFQLVPTAFLDVWQSADGRAHLNLVAGIGIGSASASVERQEVVIDPMTGAESTITERTETSATLIPFSLGLGGDYFLHPSFALGMEAGYQGFFLTGAESEGRDLDVTANTHALYGAIRLTFVAGG